MKKIFLLFLVFVLGFSIDISVNNIVQPIGIQPPAVYTPKVRIRNRSAEDAEVSVYLKILEIPTTNQVYFDVQEITIRGNTTLPINFSPFNAASGIYLVKCSLYCANDENPENDTLSSKLRIVEIPLNQWVLWDSLPLGERKKRVKDGGGMGDGSIKQNNQIFVMKGNKTNEFYLYDPIVNCWTRKCSIPNYLLSSKYLPKNGSCICRVGNFIYLAVGNNTREFLAYSLMGDSWERRREVPFGPDSKNVKNGTFLTKGKIGNKNYLFLIKGNNTREFYAYDIDNDTWLEKAMTPYVGRETKIRKGSCLCSDGKNIYLLKGGTNEFFFYNSDSNKWEVRESMPRYNRLGERKMVRDGAFMVYEQGHDVIFAFKGGNTNEFWAYFVEGDSWHELPPLPLGPSNKKVRAGASLLLLAGGLFALKGNNTNEVWFYKYDFPLPLMTIREGRGDIEKTNRKRITNLKVFNIAGQRVNYLKRGIYFTLTDRKIKKIIIR